LIDPAATARRGNRPRQLAFGNRFRGGNRLRRFFRRPGTGLQPVSERTVPIYAKTAARPRPESRAAPACAGAVPRVIRPAMRQTLLVARNAVTAGHHMQPCGVQIAAFQSTRRGSEATGRRRALFVLSFNATYSSAVRPFILARHFVTVRPAFESTGSEATLVAGRDSRYLAASASAANIRSCARHQPNGVSSEDEARTLCALCALYAAHSSSMSARHSQPLSGRSLTALSPWTHVHCPAMVAASDGRAITARAS
jgi:hypothetical protein